MYCTFKTLPLTAATPDIWIEEVLNIIILDEKIAKLGTISQPLLGTHRMELT
jgi:hypothetical protein